MSDVWFKPFPSPLELGTFNLQGFGPAYFLRAAVTMRWVQTEYVLKGVYLGLLLYVALQEPGWEQTLWVAACALGGLALALGVAAYRKVREGYQVRGRLLSFLLFLLLENPVLVNAGILVGMAVGANLVTPAPWSPEWLMPATVLGGVILGYALWYLRQVRGLWMRLGLGLGLAALLGGGTVFWVQGLPHGPERIMFGTLVLLGIPLFYLLTFAGVAEESEVEIAAMCAALFAGLWVIGTELWPGSPHILFAAVGLPVALYVVYTRWVLPGLRVFKHVLRGLSYARIGQYRPALQKLKRALQLDPRNALAREVLWGVHREMDFEQIVHDPETLALVDFNLCLERAGSLLLAAGPKPAHLQEAHRLLDLVARQRPDMRPACDYWRAVAFTHAKQFAEAAAALEAVVTPPAEGADNPYRAAVLMPAWQLALVLHPEMARRVGAPQLALPGRRMEAIAAVEHRLAANPEDPDAWTLKRLLYSELTQTEYEQAAGADKPAAGFDHGYAQQLGLALINDPARWQRGGEYLRIAARGVLALGPALFIQIAKAHERVGDIPGVWHNYELAKRAGRAAGPKNLSDEDRHNYFAVVKLLAEKAAEEGDLDGAIENYLLYREYERSGRETYRALAGLYERKKDAWGALHATEQALVYGAPDQDLKDKKDKYYYSVMPDQVRERWETIAKYFDVGYCVQKAQALLKAYDGNLDLLDWAQHLADLAQAAQADNLTAKVIRARTRMLQGEKDEAQAVLEDVYTNKPERFLSSADEDSWYTACKILGNMYLHELNRPELAVKCLLDFRKSSKSGADTMFRLGQAYEELGDRARAIKCYNQVTAFEGHPLAPDAHDALERLKT
jgi:tetratricopeptide (TPR) repeat protein